MDYKSDKLISGIEVMSATLQAALANDSDSSKPVAVANVLLGLYEAYGLTLIAKAIEAHTAAMVREGKLNRAARGRG